MSCRFQEKKILPFPAEKLYAIVSDVSSYADFLPGCQDVRILEEGDQFIRAELTIGYSIFKESYISRVHFTPHERIEVEYESGPFKYLENHWAFTPLSENETEVEFFIDFSLKNPLLQKAMKSIFDESISHLMEAFEERVSQKLP